MEILEDEDTILLYPSANAVSIDRLPVVGVDGQRPYNLVLLDGTWPQAKVNILDCFVFALLGYISRPDRLRDVTFSTTLKKLKKRLSILRHGS